jgi:hypothetical protein
MNGGKDIGSVPVELFGTFQYKKAALLICAFVVHSFLFNQAAATIRACLLAPCIQLGPRARIFRSSRQSHLIF